MPPVPRVLALILILFVPLTGCSAYRPPTLEIAGVTVAERSPEATRVDFEVELTNPNDEPLELRTFTYTLNVDGHTVFNGRRSAEATLARKSTRRIVLPAVITTDAAVGPGPEYRYQLRGSLLYITPGELAEILLDTGLRKPRVRFSREGVVEIAGPGAP
jgi:hypothetical protein